MSEANSNKAGDFDPNPKSPFSSRQMDAYVMKCSGDSEAGGLFSADPSRSEFSNLVGLRGVVEGLALGLED